MAGIALVFAPIKRTQLQTHARAAQHERRLLQILHRQNVSLLRVNEDRAAAHGQHWVGKRSNLGMAFCTVCDSTRRQMLMNQRQQRSLFVQLAVLMPSDPRADHDRQTKNQEHLSGQILALGEGARRPQRHAGVRRRHHIGRGGGQRCQLPERQIQDDLRTVRMSACRADLHVHIIHTQ